MDFSVVNFCWLFLLLSYIEIDAINYKRYQHHQHHKLIVVSLDAFKPIYLEKNITPFIEQFYKNGIIATHMNNSFPTKTFVNHFSIGTGLHPKTHGVTGNVIYDLHLGLLTYSSALFHFNKNSIPLWTLNELQHGCSGVMMWPGSEFEYQGVNPTFVSPLNKTIGSKERVDEVITWLDKGANLVMFYIEEPDDEGHAYGPDSDQESEMIKKVDLFVGYLEKALKKAGLDSQTDVIVLSDHGMMTVIPRNFINLYDFIDANVCQTYGGSPVVQIICINGRVDEACKNLTDAGYASNNFKAYTNKQLPERWHVRNEQRFGPCTAVAEPGYAFQDMYDSAEWFSKKNGVQFDEDTMYGIHGYDNWVPDMKPIFMAKGPSFKNGVTVDSEFSNVDLYHLFCKLLGLNPRAIDGIDRKYIWRKMLKK